MSRYLIDTDICIFLLKKKYGIKEKIERVGIENCFISEITIAELTYGAFRSERLEKHLKEVKDIEGLFKVIPIVDSIELFGKEKARLRREGTLIPDFDLLIGTTAVSHEMLLVTNNGKHLSRIEGVEIENWVES